MNNVKKLFLAGVLTLSAATAFAVTSDTAPTTLAQAMKAMSGKLKIITVQATDASRNADSATLADDFVAGVAQARTFVPDSIKNLPPDQLAKQKELYLQMIDKASDQGKKLAAAFRANDNALASQILNQLVDTKKQGHTEFKQ